jgi:hypothetical protein
MSKQPKRHGARGSQQQIPPLCCVHCSTDSHLFINSITPSSADPAHHVEVLYTCTRCGVRYRHTAEASHFDGLDFEAGSQDVVVFSGQYIHCRRSMQETASGVLRLDGRVLGEESGKPLDVYLDIRLMECACGYRLVLPD